MTDREHGPIGEPDAEERVLRAGLSAPALSAQAMQRIRIATQAEWHTQTGLRKPRRWVAAAVGAAVLIAAIGSATLLGSKSNEGAILGELVRADAPGMVQLRTLRADVIVAASTRLRAGVSFEARGDSLIALEGGGNLRLARGSLIDPGAANSVKLERGELYVDIPPGARGNNTFTITTAAGEFRHVGTQFAVAVVNGATRLRVREGTVRWHANEGDSAVNAGIEVLIDQNHGVTQRPIATAGRDWSWAEAMVPEIVIEDRPLLEFLTWISRETGRELILADAVARMQAASIHMHGNIRGLSATEALSAVMASTTLRFELPEGAIRVSSGRDPARPPT